MESPPLPVTFLQNYIKSWKMTEEGILIYPKSDEFDELTLRPHFTLFTGEPLAWEFIAAAKVPVEKTNEKSVELYKRLKAAECELKWRGLIRKKPRFGTMTAAGANSDLATILNVNENLGKALKSAKIDQLRVAVFSSQHKAPEGTITVSNTSESEPKKMIWVIMALKSYILPIERLNMTKCKSDFTNTFTALSEVSKMVKILSRNQIMR